MGHHEGYLERRTLVKTCLASRFLATNALALEFLGTQANTRGNTSTTTQASNFTSTPSIVAQIGTGEYLISVSESSGAYHSLGRGRSMRLQSIANSVQSFARVKHGRCCCSAASISWIDISVRPWRSNVVGYRHVCTGLAHVMVKGV